VPFQVRKWPDNCDPRGACFCLLGYDAGAVPPWKYFAHTTGASFPYQRMNTGVEITFFAQSHPSCFFQGFSITPVLLVDMFTSPIGLPPFLPAPAHTLLWTLKIIDTGSGNFHEGSASLRLPVAVDQPPGISVFPNVGPDLLPNPILLRPRRWDA